jgi:hypothetical protein
VCLLVWHGVLRVVRYGERKAEWGFLVMRKAVLVSNKALAKAA